MDEVNEKLKQLAAQVRDERKINANTATRIGSLFLALAENFERYLSKAHPDETEHLLKFLAGAWFGDYVPGISGGMIDKDGSAELKRLLLRGELIVPELRYNRVTVFKGYNIISPGGGCVIREVVDNGNGTYTCTPDLEEGEPLSQFDGDIMLAYWHDKNEQTGAFKGFREMKFRVTAVDYDAGTFVLMPRPDTNAFPEVNMTLGHVGSFTNEERQTYIAIDTRDGNNCITFYDDANTWDITTAQEKSWFGKKKNRKVQGIDASTYSAVLRNVIMSGSLFQVDEITGDEVRVPIDKGKFVKGTTYGYYQRVSHNGGLWLCVNEKGTNAEPSETDPSWLCQVSPGAGVTSSSEWKSADCPYEQNTILSFADKIWISNKETSEAPYPLITDKDGNRYLQTQDDGQTYGYIVAENVQSADWDLLFDPTAVLKGVKYTDVLYAISSRNDLAPTTGWQTYAPEWEEGKYIWSKTETVYTDGTSNVSEPFCLPVGKSGRGIKLIVEEYYLSSSPQILSGGEWSTNPPAWRDGWYYWTRSTITYTDDSSFETDPICVSGGKGKDGNSITFIGDWYTGLQVPYLGIVRMGNATWLCNNENGTTNPPLWCVTDKDGNRYLQTQDNGKTWNYILTGETNSEEYEMSTENGVGVKSMIEEYYRSSSATVLESGNWTTNRPLRTKGWYIWTRMVTIYTDGTETRTEGICISGDDGKDGTGGIPGCIMRTPEWVIGKEYRNDEDLSSGTRFLDVAMVRDNSLTTGWKPYKCIKTHISSTANAPGNREYWEEFGLNVNAIYSPLILGENSNIEFMQSNQLLVKDSIGNVVGGISGEGYYWMGGPSPFNAMAVDRADSSGHRAGGNISWDEKGNAAFKGQITATSGVFYGYNLTPYKIYKGNGVDFPDLMDGMNIMLTYDRGNMAFTLPTDKKYDGLEIEILYTSGTYYAQINSPGNLRLYWRGEYITHIILFGEFTSVRLKAFKNPTGEIIWRIMNASDFKWIRGSSPASTTSYAQSKVGGE